MSSGTPRKFRRSPFSSALTVGVDGCGWLSGCGGQQRDHQAGQQNEILPGFHFNSCSRFCISFFNTSLSSPTEVSSVFALEATTGLGLSNDSVRPANCQSPSSCFFICTPTPSSTCWPLASNMTRLGATSLIL